MGAFPTNDFTEATPWSAEVEVGEGPVSIGPAARFEDDHRCLGRPPGRGRVEPGINCDPALPQPSALLPDRLASAHRARLLVGHSNDGVGVRFEVAPPRGVALVPAVHRDRDEVRAVFEIADDDAALLPGLPPDGGEASRPSRACSTWSTGIGRHSAGTGPDEHARPCARSPAAGVSAAGLLHRSLATSSQHRGVNLPTDGSSLARPSEWHPCDLHESEGDVEPRPTSRQGRR